MTTHIKTTGARIRDHREHRGMTQHELANRVGVRDLAVGKWERDQQNPSPDNLVALAKVFGIAPQELGYEPPSWAPDAPPAWFIQFSEQLFAEIRSLREDMAILKEPK